MKVENKSINFLLCNFQLEEMEESANEGLESDRRGAMLTDKRVNDRKRNRTFEVAMNDLVLVEVVEAREELTRVGLDDGRGEGGLELVEDSVEVVVHPLEDEVDGLEGLALFCAHHDLAQEDNVHVLQHFENLDLSDGRYRELRALSKEGFIWSKEGEMGEKMGEKMGTGTHQKS